ncbi:MAG TPA: hypothetical protein VK582_12325 [Pyrinomonadaceae bacterium]|nr:hypothetical protein [Pyrinomonadaceae bacterium]
MMITPYRCPERSLLLWLALPVFPLLIFQPARQTITARVGAGVPVAQWPAGRGPLKSLSSRQPRNLIVSGKREMGQGISIPLRGKAKSKAEIIVETIAKTGPTLGETIIMSGFSMSGFAKDGWPLVICYELEERSAAELTITTKDGKQPFVIELQSTNGQPAEIMRQLPPQFGKEPQIALFSFQAFKNGPGERKPAEFFLCGLGLGPHAVGSMVIDRLEFQPDSIRPRLKEQASYSFHSSSDFDTVAAEFRLVTRFPGRGVSSQLAFRETLQEGVARDGSVTKFWDGKNSKGKISQGPHQFYVRAWRGLKSGADWVFAAKNQLVTVVE